MKTRNGYIVRKCANPCSNKKLWPGQWFEFARKLGGEHWEEGAAHWTSLASYIGEEAWLEVVSHYRSIRGMEDA